ncbi:hypothetical protein F3K34_27140 [Streptomyces sp. LBUM 1486]|nr:hypothetical protein [Streptomyces sp. LBUM 1486]
MAARIAAARVKVQAAKERRDDLAAARRRGLAHRHTRKLKNLADAEPRAQQQTLDDEPTTSPRAGGSGAEPDETP